MTPQQKQVYDSLIAAGAPEAQARGAVGLIPNNQPPTDAEVNTA